MKISKRRVEYSHLGGNLRLVSMTDEERKELAQQHNTEKWAISPNLYFVEFSSFNRNYRGYGIRNVNGGIEFINPLYMKNPITLDNKDMFMLLTLKMTAISIAVYFGSLRIILLISPSRRNIF